MRPRYTVQVLFGIMALLGTQSQFAQEFEGDGSVVKWGGYLQADNRVLLGDDHDYSWNEYRFVLETKARPLENAQFHSEVWLRWPGYQLVENSADLSSKNNVAPNSLEIREAYVDLFGFLFKDLDLRIGRQRIAWGAADKMNPTDNLNPYDLEDVWDFGRHLGSDGVKGTVYLGDFTLTGVYIPIFTPAVMPGTAWSSALSSSMSLPAGVVAANTSDNIALPEYNPFESSVMGIKVATFLFGYDFSVSYVYGRDGLPAAKKVTLSGATSAADIQTELVYPRMHIVGADMAGAVGDIGLWAEAAVFFPEEIETSLDLSSLGLGSSTSTALSDKPYVKYVVGADYTFKNGVYINGQYVHGFFHERGRDNLKDYFMFGLEWKSSDEKLKIIPIGGGIEINDFEDIENNYALIYTPEISYYPFANAEFTLGVHWIEGKNTTTFGKAKDNSEAYLRVKFSF